jgi:ketosteroid isomerase-like protein
MPWLGRVAPALLAGCAAVAPGSGATDMAARAAEVRAAEIAFARTMADRDFAAFATHVADDAVFLGVGQTLRGKAAVLAHWKGYFEGPAAPFAWRPEIVEVAAGGELGYSEGPVTGADGKVFVRYFSTWRRDPASGRWLVVFDNGYRVCNCPR